MIRGIRYSKRLAAVAAAALASALAASWFRALLASEGTGQRRAMADLESQLSSRIGAMSAFDDEHLSALREQAARFRERLGEPGTLGRLSGRFGEGWASEPGPKEDMGGYSVQYATFKKLAPALSDWPAIVEAVGDSEAMPGVGVVGLEMRASGDRDRRALDLVRVLVAVRTGHAAPIREAAK